MVRSAKKGPVVVTALVAGDGVFVATGASGRKRALPDPGNLSLPACYGAEQQIFRYHV